MASRYSGVALITNAGNAVGLAIVLCFLEAGCVKIIVSDDSRDRIEELRAAILQSAGNPVQIHGVVHDRSDDTGWETVVAKASEIFGDIHYYVNCSKLTPPLASPKPTADLEPSIFKAALQDTSRELWLCCRAQLRQCLLQRGEQKGRTIVNIIPYGNLGTHPGHAILAASTFQRVGMTKTFARDHVKDGIRINAVCPGLTVSEAGSAPVLQEHMEANGRLIDEIEVAKAVLFLTGGSSSGMTGLTLPVDGGWSLAHN